MINLVRRIFFLVQRRDRVRDEIDGNDVDAIGRAEGKRRKPREKNESAHHIELVRFRAAAVAQHDAGAENRARHVRKQLADHVLAEFFRARVGIVIRAVPIDGRVFLDHFVGALAGNGDGAHVAEAAQAVIVARAHRQLNHFERAAQIHVEAAFLRFAIQRCGAMNHGIGGADQLRGNRRRRGRNANR